MAALASLTTVSSTKKPRNKCSGFVFSNWAKLAIAIAIQPGRDEIRQD
jgi:hypothetical protein